MRPFFYLLLSIVLTTANAQQTARIADEYLVWFRSSAAARQFLAEKSDTWTALRRLSDQPCIYLVQNSDESALAQLRRQPDVLQAQAHHRLEWRSLPNDPKYSQWQWNLDSLGLPQAWNYTTGGLSPNGDTIVVGIIDAGCDTLHEDLAGQLWVNRAEIPNNGIDDDQNGWTDDYRGWNVVQQNDQHPAATHGTSVAGIVGAEGNNGLGVAGINWKVKLLIITADVNEADAIEAYCYLLAQRRRYRQTNGAQGAYIVSSNASWGIDYAKAEDYPIWCALYDTLGAEGILNVAATANLHLNVDQQGDMPTTCASDFLVAVTQSTQANALHPFAAYGAQSIDLAAPGAVYTTRPNDTYNVFGGTSGAAPHVAAAIALLYAYPHAKWAALQRDQPDAAALFVKDLLLSSVRPVSDLAGVSTSGGILHIGNAMRQLAEYFEEPAETEILSIFPTPAQNETTLRVAISEAGEYALDVFDMTGKRTWSERLYVNQPQILYHSIPLYGWAKGLYGLRLSKGRKRWTGKLMVGE